MRTARLLTIVAAGVVATAIVAARRGCFDAPPSPVLGSRIYRDGMLASGAPVTAVVEGDVPVDGTQLTCVHCHQRSGMGSAEGRTFVPPVSGAVLYRPRESPPAPRPAYTDETLTRAIREGVDPAGRRLDPLMPRYALPDQDVGFLISHLKTLSAAPSPGVTETTIDFATVVGDGVDAHAVQSMLDVLETFFREKNGQTRNESERRRRDRIASAGTLAYRQWILHRWTLHGPSDTWAPQLEAHYREAPVFALLSGIAPGSWRPIHEFCERHQVPCLLPNTDLPVVSSEDYYTLYFSQGLTLEARAIAQHLAGPASRLLQVFRRGDPAGEAAAAALRAALDARGTPVVDLILSPDARPGAAIAGKLDDAAATAVVLWLPGRDLEAIGPGRPTPPPAIYLSSTLLGGDPSTVPAALRGGAYLVHPFSLPDDLRARLRRVETWATSRRMPVGDARVLAQTWFACLVTGDALMHVGSALNRDYFLEAVDHLSGTAALSPFHPSPSFGRGQRYLAKGCYVLRFDRDATVAEPSWLPIGG